MSTPFVELAVFVAFVIGLVVGLLAKCAWPTEDKPPVKECPSCELRTSFRLAELQRTEFVYGTDSTVLVAWVPRWRCANCGYQFGDSEAEDAFDAVIQEHKNKLRGKTVGHSSR